MKLKNSKLIVSAILFVIFAVLVAAVLFIDVAAIGPSGSSVGLSGINGYFRDLFGENMLWYDVTEILGFAAIATGGVFALLGLLQLIGRRSLKKVDADILLLAAFYAVVLGAYVFFEIFVVNYRPVIIDGELEASFPSSHTMLVVCFVGAAVFQARRRISNGVWRAISCVAGLLMILVTVFGRMICGVHWFTDILGGVLLSGALLFLYVGAVELVAGKHKALRMRQR